MIDSILPTDYHLTDVSNWKTFHGYTTVTNGFSVWETRFSDSHDDNGKFNRYAEWGPFYDLVELLEKLNLMDNKIAIEYNNGLVVGLYDGRVRIGNKAYPESYARSLNNEEIMAIYKKKKA